MRILDMLKKDVFKRETVILLDPLAPNQWAQQLLAAKGIDTAYTQLTRAVTEATSSIQTALVPFRSESHLEAIPDRARTMNALHGNEYASLVEKLCKATSFSDIWQFPKDQERYLDAVSAFKDQSTKNSSVLHEFMLDELKAVQALLQGLEDTVLHAAKQFEDLGFPTILAIKESASQLSSYNERTEKYQKLMASLEADLVRTDAKRAEIENQIHEQAGLVRNESALHALETLKKREEELFAACHKYGQAAADVITITKRAGTKIPVKAKRIVEELAQDPQQALTAQHDAIAPAFTMLIEHFEEERPQGMGKIVERLQRLAGSAEQDGRMVQTTLPDLRALKRQIMGDIAALNMYDKQQFYLRAKQEADTIAHKIAYLRAELEPGKRIAIERGMKDAAKRLGAIIKDETA